MGRRGKPKGREVNGVLLLDKPVGFTSNEALQRVKSLYKAQKAGHTGSLDKGASGLLPICFGEATKFSGYLLEADKHYQALCQAGVRTDTGDADGEVIARRDPPVLTRKETEAALAGFRGEIMQVPPMFSALKHKGQRLYKLARQGLEVERAPRPVTIHALKLLACQGDEFEIDARCSKGTYIRALADDIGEALGCGAHVKSLRRIGVGPYASTGALTAGQLERLAEVGLDSLDAELLGLDTIVQDLPAVTLTPAVSYYLRQGQPVLVPRAPTQGLLRIYAREGRFLGVGEVLDDGRVAPRRLIAG